ncbi:GH25 family lysozyme [Treponema saccharophilum]|uniref:GH25 family lysozyme n=1 Tax=Treponema saccharophilum TaxID=165 RepID=UPI0030C6737F
MTKRLDAINKPAIHSLIVNFSGIDENFHENVKNAIEAGFDVGVYVYSQAINEEEALEEAELVLNEIKDYEITLPIVYDPESVGWDTARTDDVQPSVFNNNTIVFCEKIREAGYEPMIYANHIWEAFILDMGRLRDYKFWYADYEDSPQLPYDFEFWQYTSTMKVNGINKECDADIWIRPREVPASSGL